MEAAAAAGMSRRIKAGAGKSQVAPARISNPCMEKLMDPAGIKPKIIPISLGQHEKFLPSAPISPQAGAEPVTASRSLFISGMINGVGSPRNSCRNSRGPIPRARGIKAAFSRGCSSPWMIPEEPGEEQGLRCLGVLWMTPRGHSWRKSSA